MMTADNNDDNKTRTTIVDVRGNEYVFGPEKSYRVEDVSIGGGEPPMLLKITVFDSPGDMKSGKKSMEYHFLMNSIVYVRAEYHLLLDKEGNE